MMVSYIQPRSSMVFNITQIKREYSLTIQKFRISVNSNSICPQGNSFVEQL
jgi:hypothetical protein